MMDISDRVIQKLAEKHGVNREEIIQCFANREKNFLIDTREDHRTDPPTMWFIAQTDYGRKLKVVFIQDAYRGVVTIKSAYEPSQNVIDIYNRYAN